MKNTIKITKEEIIKINRSASREAELEFDLRVNRHRIDRNKKKYYRKEKHKSNYHK
jgi:hypothetical protein